MNGVNVQEEGLDSSTPLRFAQNDKAENLLFVVLPSQNFNAYLGTTAFSQKWSAALAGTLIEKQSAEAVSKYKIHMKE